MKYYVSQGKFTNNYILFAVLFLGSASVFLLSIKNAWITEDAYISFRSIEQLFAGNGPRWNFNERVQVFTSPLWFCLLAVGRVFSDDLYIVTMAVSFISLAITLCAVWMWRLQCIPSIIFFIFLCSSNAFMDYTTSGLENVLSYACIAWLVYVYPRSVNGELVSDAAIVLALVLLFLLVAIRHDLVTLAAPPLAYILYVHRRRYGVVRWMSLLAACSLPISAWTLFSLLYYGFPFPNTAYAKLSTGYSAADLFPQGLEYFAYSARYDAVTLLGIVAGMLLSVLMIKRGLWPLTAGIALNSVYVASVGGDFMQGRFISHSFLMGTAVFCVLLNHMPKRAVQWPVLFACCFFLLWQYSVLRYMPVFSNDGIRQREVIEFKTFPDITIPTVTTERAIFHDATSLAAYRRAKAEHISFPIIEWTELGLQAAKKPDRILVFSNVGIYGYHVRLDQYVVDNYALTDPLLARLPSDIGWWRPGHFVRTHYPAGYMDHILNPSSSLGDADMGEYVRNLEVLTKQEKLFTWNRLKTIVLFNFGRYEHLKDNWLKSPA